MVRGAVAELADDLAQHQQALVDVAALAQPQVGRPGLGGALRTAFRKGDSIDVVLFLDLDFI